MNKVLFMSLFLLSFKTCVGEVAEVNVVRGSTSDQLISSSCEILCSSLSVSTVECDQKNKTCCGYCKCINGKTLVNSGKKLQCVKDVRKHLECYYWSNMELLKNYGEGIIMSSNVIVWKHCHVTQDSLVFWNLLRWSKLQAHLTFENSYPIGGIMLWLKGENLSGGMLVKATIQCTDQNGKRHPESCLSIKLNGKMKLYIDVPNPSTKELTTVQDYVDTTTIPVTSVKTELVKDTKNYISFVYIGCAITLTLVLLITGTLLCVCWKKRRQSGQLIRRTDSNLAEEQETEISENESPYVGLSFDLSTPPRIIPRGVGQSNYAQVVILETTEYN